MLRRGVRSGDSLQLHVALSGFQEFDRAYIEASEVNPDARTHSYDQSTATGWLADELVPALVSAGQEAIALDIANEDANAIANTLAGFGGRSAEVGSARSAYARSMDSENSPPAPSR